MRIGSRRTTAAVYGENASLDAVEPRADVASIDGLGVTEVALERVRSDPPAYDGGGPVTAHETVAPLDDRVFAGVTASDVL